MTIRVNSAKREIVITKAFAKKAERYGSAEYNELKSAKNDNPSFKVVIKKSAKKDSLKGLTFDFMRQYIERHDDENQSNMKAFTKMTVRDEDSLATLSYGEIKKWFLEQYPTVAKVA